MSAPEVEPPAPGRDPAGWWAGGWIETLLFVVAYLAGGWKTAEEVCHKIKSGVLDIHFLMLAVAVGAACVGHWDEGALLLFLFSLSGALEELAAYRTERELAGLFRAAPREAIRILEDGTEEKVAVDLLEPGMRVRVRPGDGFPVDAEVIEGRSGADESSLTGESAAVSKGYPASIVTHGQALNITCLSYADHLEFGLVGCRRTVPKLQRLLDYLEESLRELE
jgi:Cd2+/Zn2+-exporting ATPase